MDLVVAVVAHAGELDGGFGRREGGDGDVAGRVQELEVGCVEEIRNARGTVRAEDAAALSAMLNWMGDEYGAPGMRWERWDNVHVCAQRWRSVCCKGRCRSGQPENRAVLGR